MVSKFSKHSVLVMSLTALLAGCGGGGGGGGNSTAPFSSNSFSGTAVDFYLKNATVQFDNCKNPDGSTVTTTTGPQGQFTFSTTQSCQNSPITITGGVDIATNLNFTGTLKLKATDLQKLSSNTLVVSPLTTLQVYSGAANIQTLLSSLGLSADAMSKLQAANFDLAKFNPVVDASAKDMAIIFVVQQLATQIEDSLQAVNKSDGSTALTASKATEIAFGAIVKQLETGSLFTSGTAQIDSTALQNILTTAVANAETAINDSKVDIDPSVISQIDSNISTVSADLNTVVTNNSSLTGAQLQTKLQNNEGGIQTSISEQLKTPVYADFNLANYSISQIQNSSSTSPMSISLSQLSSALLVSFKLNNAKSELTDTVKFAFKMHGTRGSSQQEDLNVTVNNIKVNFNLDGSIKSAVIPANTTVAITSTFNTVQGVSFQIDHDINIASSNGAISLQQLINSSDKLQGYYNQFYGKLAANDAIKVTAFVLPITYVVDAALNLPTDTAEFNNEKFVGSTLTAYFKLN
ncbi:hypothetical protein [Acinetobacter bouvetii]|uniref:Uncharacterized protein n=1 Tax=Acinetobacter bouvetii TaxID=202951 RepID=A0A811GFG4_9GAMM|nr:hypothetical protein [Acinetobacter bouvetii]CAB1219190.1 hypothetical protein SFB21_2380 [Acinetobacter bouvetii]